MMMSMRLTAVAVAIAATCPVTIVAQAGPDSTPAAPPREKVLTVARDVIRGARYAVLVTIAQDGQPQARIVDPFAPEDDLTIWVGTKPVTRKVADVRRDSRVTLLYFDAAAKGYVSLIGKAEVVSDAAERTRHWKQEWAGMYKDGSSGDDYVLIRIRPTRLEIVSPRAGLISDPDTWLPVTIDVP